MRTSGQERYSDRPALRLISMILAVVLGFTVMPLQSYADDWWRTPSSETTTVSGESTASRRLTKPPTPKKQLDPKDPHVDETRIVAVPKDDTTPVEVKTEVLQSAGELDALPQTTIVVNQPLSSERDRMVVVESDAEVAGDLMEMMRDSGLYETIDYDALVHPVLYSSAPNDPLYRTNSDGSMWGLGAFPGAQFTSAWALLDSARGSANTAPIAVIDTGFDMSVQDRASNIVAGYDFGAGDSNVNPDAVGSDSNAFHGTAVAGLIGAATNNGVGIAGASWDNKVVVYKAADKSGAIYLSSVTDCINDVVAKKNARIINMSLGGSAFPAYFRQAIDAAIAADILVIASSGNDALVGNPVLYPAAYGPVISVGAINSSGAPSGFSSHNSAVDLAAPGERVKVMGLKSSYMVASGTSFAAPYVASAAAMVWRMSPGLTAKQVSSILINTSVSNLKAPAQITRNEYTGAGTLDAYGAMQVAAGLPMEPTVNGISAAHHGVTVSWIDAGDEMTTIRNFVVYYRLETARTWNSVVTDSATHSVRLGGLKEGERYIVAVSAKNSLGIGPKSTQRYAATYKRSIKVSKTSVVLKRGKSQVVKVGAYYPEPSRVTGKTSISWTNSKKKIATVTSVGGDSKQAKKGEFVVGLRATDGAKVNSTGKTVRIKAGKTKGTTILTFKSGTATAKIKVVVK